MICFTNKTIDYSMVDNDELDLAEKINKLLLKYSILDDFIGGKIAKLTPTTRMMQLYEPYAFTKLFGPTITDNDLEIAFEDVELEFKLKVLDLW